MRDALRLAPPLEVAMARTAIRYTLSALAALVLVSTFASGPASGGMRMQHMHDDLMSGLKGIKKPKAHEGFATQKGPQAPYIHPVDPEGSTRLKINTPMGE